MLYPQWQSHLAGLRAGSVPSPLLVSSHPTRPTTVASPVAWPHWGSDPKADLAETKKKAVFFSWRKNSSQKEPLAPDAADAGRADVQHVLRGGMEEQGEAVLLPGQDYVTPETAVGHLIC